MSFSRTIRSSFKLVSDFKSSAVVLLIIMLFTALVESLSLGMIMPVLEAIVSEKGASGGSLQYLSIVLEAFPEYYWLMIVISIMGILIFIKNIFILLRTWLSFRYSLRFMDLWMSRIMEKYMHANYIFLMSQKQGILLNNLITEPARASKALQMIIEFASNIVLAVFLYIILLTASWQITLGITVVIGSIVFLVRKVSYNYSVNVGNQRLSLSQDLNATGAESISAIRQIKIFSLENETSGKFAATLKNLIDILLKFRVISVTPRPVGETIIIAIFVFVLLYLQYVSHSSLADILPTIALFTLISQRFIPITSALYTQRMDLLSLLPSMELVYDIFTTNIPVEEIYEGKEISELKDDIVFDNVTYAYARSNPFFNDLSLTIPKGKVTAIVGTSGSGKSTIVDLLVGFLKNQGGKLSVNGMDLKEISMRSWRNRVGYISQDTFLFNASVKDNILTGRPGATDEEIIAAAKMANAHGFIEQLPQGYDTQLGDRGMTVSGGERQRIAIARVIIRNPDLFIFDEATSELDTESEQFIQESINSLAGRKTIVIIAHKFSILKNADQIIVLDKGKIVETGTHNFLVRAGGEYSRLAGEEF